MERVFRPTGFLDAPDGTAVSPFLNGADSNQTDVPWGALGQVSVAAGRIGPGVASWIHVHPAVSQVTYLLAGALTIRMREPGADVHYELHPVAGEAVVTRPGTLLQLHNESDAAAAQVLYVVSPPYVFEARNGEVLYDDAVLVARTWAELEAAAAADLQAMTPARAVARAAALRRLAARK